VNISLQICKSSTALAQSIAASAAAGNLIVAIAGNTSFVCGLGVVFPGRYPEVVAVSGTMQNDAFAYPNSPPCSGGSRHGPEVELAAPYVGHGMRLHGGYGAACGTSFAAPIVSGVAALLWTKFPFWSATQVRQHLAARALDLGHSGRDNYFGYGRVDAALALNPGMYLPTAPTLTGPSVVQPGASCQWMGDPGTGPTQPLSYSWRVDGSPQPGSASDFFYTAGGNPFIVTMIIVDSDMREWTASHEVDVSYAAPPCPLPQ
jgi:subtilisin family serine protease